MFLRSVKGQLPSEKDLERTIITSNHTFTGDPGLLYFLFHKNARVVHKANVGSFDIITRHKILVGGDKDQVKATIMKDLIADPTPVIIYPEGATTNGNVGLLRYSAFVFGLNRPIQPVGLRYARFFGLVLCAGLMCSPHSTGTTRRCPSCPSTPSCPTTRSTCSSWPSSRGCLSTRLSSPWCASRCRCRIFC